MKKLCLKLSVAFSLLCFTISSVAQTQGTLTFTFTEVPQSITYNGDAQHVLAVWIQSTAGTFVKTKLRYAGNITSDHLPTWAVNSGGTAANCLAVACNTVDGTTGATRTAWTTYSVSWDGKMGPAATGTLQPDGIYKVTIQSTWDHGSTGTATTSYTFTKGPAVDHQTPIANSYYSGINLNWTPAAPPTASLTSSNLKCSENPISFSDASTGTPTSWTWSFPGGTPSIATSSNVSVTYTAGGTYSVTHTAASSSGTSTPITQTFVVNSTPTLATSNASICMGSTVSISASGASSYVWNTGATSPSITVNPTATTIYSVTGSTTGCSSIKVVTVTVNSIPTVVVNSSTICAGSTASLSASGANTYTWSTGSVSANISVSPSVTTIYSVTGTSPFGCSNTSTASVNITSAPSIVVSSASICSGASVILSATGVTTYTWNTGANTSTISVAPIATSVYTVSGNLIGCSAIATKTVDVSVVSNPTVTANSASICATNSIVLLAQGASSYMWNTGVSSASVSVSPTVTTNYTITGTTLGCSDSKIVTVTVNALPLVNFSTISSSLCVSNAPINLSGTPAGGVYSGLGVVGSSFDPSLAGVGTFTLVYSYTNTVGCSALSSNSVTVSLCTNIENFSHSNLISVYPNPVSSFLNIEIEPTFINSSMIELYDMIGNLVTIQKPVSSITIFSFSHLPNGLYTIRVSSDNNQKTFKIIKD